MLRLVFMVLLLAPACAQAAEVHPDGRLQLLTIGSTITEAVPPASFIMKTFTLDLPPDATRWMGWKVRNWANYPLNVTSGVGVNVLSAMDGTLMGSAWVTAHDQMPLEDWSAMGGFECPTITVTVRCYNLSPTAQLAECGSNVHFFVR